MCQYRRQNDSVISLLLATVSGCIYVDLEHFSVMVNVNIFVQYNSAFPMLKSLLNNMGPIGNKPIYELSIGFGC